MWRECTGPTIYNGPRLLRRDYRSQKRVQGRVCVFLSVQSAMRPSERKNACSGIGGLRIGILEWGKSGLCLYLYCIVFNLTLLKK